MEQTPSSSGPRSPPAARRTLRQPGRVSTPRCLGRVSSTCPKSQPWDPSRWLFVQPLGFPTPSVGTFKLSLAQEKRGLQQVGWAAAPHRPPCPLLLKFVSLRGSSLGPNVELHFLPRKRASWKQCLSWKSMSLHAVRVCLFYYRHFLLSGFGGGRLLLLLGKSKEIRRSTWEVEGKRVIEEKRTSLPLPQLCVFN